LSCAQGKEKEKVVDEATTLEDEDEEVEEKETEEELFPEDHVGYQEPRVVAINRPDLNMHYKFKNNYVSTTKYNVGAPFPFCLLFATLQCARKLSRAHSNGLASRSSGTSSPRTCSSSFVGWPTCTS
jgi:hypothetical protein